MLVDFFTADGCDSTLEGEGKGEKETQGQGKADGNSDIERARAASRRRRGPLWTLPPQDTVPVYMLKSGKWTLMQGIGPQKLETFKASGSGGVPWRLPAGQFRTLLPGVVAPTPASWSSAGS